MKSLFTRLAKHVVSAAMVLSFTVSCLSGVSIATEVIVDDGDATGVTYTGTWNNITLDSGSYYNALHSDGASGRGTKQVRFTPNLPVAGVYRIDGWWRGASSCATQVPFIINSSEGTYTTNVNQRINGNRWITLTQRQFAAGSNPTTGSVTITNTGTTDGAVNADAFRFTLVTGTEVIVDDDDSSKVLYTGTWTRTNNEEFCYGPSFRSDGNSGKGTKEVRFTPNIPVAGYYSVDVWWNMKTSRATNVPVDYRSIGGLVTQTVDQRNSFGNDWNGSFSGMFATGSNPATGSVTIRNTGTNGVVSADAVRWQLVEATPTTAPIILSITPGNNQINLDWDDSPNVGYRIYRSTTPGGTGTTQPITWTSSSDYQDYGLTNGTTYYYTIRKASSLAGDGPASAEVSSTPIMQPDNPSVTATNGNGSVILNWGAAARANSYYIERGPSTNGPFTTLAPNLTVTTLTFTDTTVTNGTTYHYRVFAKNPAGSVWGSASATPMAPTVLSVTPGNGQAYLSWTPVAGSASYRVYGSTSSGVLGSFVGYGDYSTRTFTQPITNGTPYYFTVKPSSNDAGEGPSSNQVSVTGIPAPVLNPPTLSNGQVSLSWSAVIGPSISYQVFRAPNGSSFSTTALSTVTSTTYTDTSATNGTDYQYKIRACNPSPNDSLISGIVNATPLGATTLGGTPGNGQANLTWSAVTGATKYRVYQSTTAGSLGNSLGETASTTSTPIVANATPYYYTIKAVNLTGDGPNSNQFAVTAIAPPATLSATAGNSRSVLTWGSVLGANAYKVYRRLSPTGTPTIFSPGAVTSYVDSTASNNTLYYYTVTALNSTGESASSSQVTATPFPPPPAATGLTATPGNAQVTLSWNAITGANVINYKVFRGTTTNMASATLIASPTAPTYLDNGAANGVTYYYFVRAINDTVDGAASAQVSATPLAPLTSSPTLVANGSNAKVDLSWNSIVGATGYKITRRPTPTGAVTTFTVTGQGTTAYPDTAVANNTTYYYSVSATNVGGDGPDSNQVKAVPGVPFAAPTGLTGVGADSRVTLTWTPVSGASCYYVYRRLSGTGTLILVEKVTAAQYLDADVQNDIAYDYAVSSVRSIPDTNDLIGPMSVTITVTPQAAPSSPMELSITTGNTRVLLNWTAADRATGYVIWMRAGTGSWSQLSSLSSVVAGTPPTKAVTGLTNGTIYNFFVRSTNSAGESVDSNVVEAVPQAITPHKPAVVTFGTISSTSITFIPPALPFDATSLNIYYAPVTTNSSDVLTLAASSVTSTTPITLSGLPAGVGNGISYSFRAEAVNSSGSTSGDLTTATTNAVTASVGAPATPNKLLFGTIRYNATDGHTIPVQCLFPTNATGSGISWALQWKLTADPSTTFSDTGHEIVLDYYQQVELKSLLPLTSYDFRLKATNSSGTTYSAVASATTLDDLPAAPLAPVIPAGTITTHSVTVTVPALPARATSLTLNWLSSTGSIGSSPTGTLTNVTGTSVTVSNLTSNQSLQFYWTAQNATGKTDGPSATVTTATGASYQAPGAPLFFNLTDTSVEVISPTNLQDFGSVPIKLRLEGKASSDLSYQIIENDMVYSTNPNPLDASRRTLVNDLTPGLTYSFRYVAYPAGSPASSVNGATASIIIPNATTSWNIGPAIACNGIRYPYQGKVISGGSLVRLNSMAAVDIDWMARTVDNRTTIFPVTDVCRYTWTASAGSFPDGNVGATVNWQAPTVATSTPVTFTLWVIDAGGLNKATGDGGTRADTGLQASDVPMHFQTTVQIAP